MLSEIRKFLPWLFSNNFPSSSSFTTFSISNWNSLNGLFWESKGHFVNWLWLPSPIYLVTWIFDFLIVLRNLKHFNFQNQTFSFDTKKTLSLRVWGENCGLSWNEDFLIFFTKKYFYVLWSRHVISMLFNYERLRNFEFYCILAHVTGYWFQFQRTSDTFSYLRPLLTHRYLEF